MLLKHGLQTPPREVIRLLKDQGLPDVSPQQVSNEKAKLRQRGTLPSVNDDLPISIIKKVKSLVDEVGSIAIIRKALDDLEQLQSRGDGTNRH